MEGAGNPLLRRTTVCLQLGQGVAWQELGRQVCCLGGSAAAVLQKGTLHSIEPQAARAQIHNKSGSHCWRDLWQVAPHMITCVHSVYYP